MDIVADLIAWADSLPEWQSDALRRLFQKHVLSDQDQNEIYGMLQLKNGVDVEVIDPVPIRLMSSHIPLQPGGNVTTKLESIKKVVGINAIASDQELKFSPAGITAIYGDNGVGKSGYARILKKACRSRDSREIIHPNIFNSGV